MGTREYSPKEIQDNLIEISRKNFYEISWNIRKQVAHNFIAENNGVLISEILDHLEAFENQYLCQLEIVSSDKESSIGEQNYYTGNVNVTPSGGGGSQMTRSNCRDHTAMVNSFSN